MGSVKDTFSSRSSTGCWYGIIVLIILHRVSVRANVMLASIPKSYQRFTLHCDPMVRKEKQLKSHSCFALRFRLNEKLGNQQYFQPPFLQRNISFTRASSFSFANETSVTDRPSRPARAVRPTLWTCSIMLGAIWYLKLRSRSDETKDETHSLTCIPSGISHSITN